MERRQRMFGFGLALLAGLAAAGRADRTVMNDFFRVTFNDAGVASLRRGPGPDAPEVLAPGRTLGHVVARYRMWTGPWQDFSTEALAAQRTVKQGSDDGAAQLVLVTNGSGWYDYFADLEFTERFRIEEDALYWTLHFRNVTHKPVEISTLYLPLPFEVRSAGGTEGRWVRTGVVRGKNSYVTFAPVSGAGPCLVLLPVNRCPLFEPAQTERNYAAVEVRAEDEGGVFLFGGPGADPKAVAKLTPKFTPGDELTYGFKFRWAADASKVRELLRQEGIAPD